MPTARSVILELSSLPTGNTASAHLLSITTGVGDSTIQIFGEINIQQTEDSSIILSPDYEVGQEESYNIILEDSLKILGEDEFNIVGSV
jgi:hypothetical protein